MNQTRRSARLVTLGSIALLSAVSSVSGQTWIGANQANWNVASNWNPAVEPNSGTASVTVSGTSIPVIPNAIVRSVGTLNVSAATSGVTIAAGGRLSVHNILSNAGTVTVAGAAASYLQPVGTVTFSGTGAVVLGTGDLAVIGDLTNANGASDLLTNGPGHTIRGRGTIGLANSLRIVNNGIIEASTTNGRLKLLPSNLGLQNNGTIRATGNAAFDFDGTNGGAFDNTNGTIDIGAGMATLLLNNARIVGGTITGTTAGLNTSTSGVLENLTLNAIARVNPGTSLDLVGTIVNNRPMVVAGNTGTAFLQPRGSVTLNGTGSIELFGLSGATLGDNANVNAANDHLTNGLTHTIKGEGAIGIGSSLRITNNGLIDGIYSRPLFIRAGTGGFTNDGTVRATTTVTIEGGEQFGAGEMQTVTAASLLHITSGANGNTANRVTGLGTFRVSGTGTNVTVSHARVGTLEVFSPARLTLGAAGNSGASRTNTLTVNGTLDLKSTGLVIDYTGTSPFSTVRSLLVSGRGTGNWQGSFGILTSLAATPGSGFGVGFAEASALGSPATFMGQAADATSVFVRATLLGDGNLDGNVNFDDLLALAANYNVTTGRSWVQGDFDYDGAVNFNDLLVLAANYNRSGDASFEGDWSLARATVPEPAAVMVLAASAAAVLRRRRSA